MKINKNQIIKNLCYTELVYERINEKLDLKLSKIEIEELISNILIATDVKGFTKTGKNYYVINKKIGVRLTINSNTFRVITADRLS